MIQTAALPRILILVLVVTMFSCDTKEDPFVPEPPRTFANVEADFSALSLSPGVHDVSLEILDGRFYNFRYIAPSTGIQQDRPLILAFHGATVADDAHKNTACYVEPGLESLDAFILSPFAEGGLWYEDKNQVMMADLIFLIRKYWPIETDKIAVTGYSNGGNASWLFSKLQPNTISAAIPMASSYDVHELDGSVAVWDVPLYVIHGQNDELFPVDTTRAWVDATINAGSDVTLVVAPDLGHYTPCEYVPHLKDAATWLDETVWKN